MSTDEAPIDDIVGWDVTTWATAVTFWEQSFGEPDRVLRCLEVGAGPGGPSLWLALKGHDVLCSNWSTTEAQAGPLHARYPGAAGIRYEDIDVMQIPYENHFDVIVFKSVLGGVGPMGVASLATQQGAMGQILKALKPGGRLFYAENLRGTVFHRLARAIAYRLRRASWRFVTIPELKRFLAGFADYELRTTGVLALFGVTESQRRALAGLDNRFVNRIVPAPWRYVAYGVATKAEA